MKKKLYIETIDQEWSVSKRWNPFNSYKLLAQVYRWEKIRRGGPIPQPVLVTVDPINVCNHRCVWCNANFVLKERHRKISEKSLMQLADYLPHWQGSPHWAPGVEAVCIAGGGEPLLNPATGEFINRLASNGIQVGVVTNGTLISENIDALSNCVWVGVSVDAGTERTFGKLKGLKKGSGSFDKIMDGIARLVDYGQSMKREIARDAGGYGVSYKYLLHPENIGEIYEAAVLAKEIGCKNFHIRPASTPWDKLGAEGIMFTEADRKLFEKQVEKARGLEDKNFGVYRITHKLDEKFRSSNFFRKCHAIFMTAVFMPPERSGDGFIMGLCCDRRGDGKLEIAKVKDVDEINGCWGSEEHWRIFDEIDVAAECPRCTYQPHNQVFERVILQDSMTFRFI
jgi:MoaA/NifB/PqqE/SkfB family radical SAM enzyme